MKEQSFFMNLVIIGASGALFLLGNITAAPVFAQGHAGHTAQTPAAVEKLRTAKPQDKPKAKQEEAVEEEFPQVDISPEQRQLIGVKSVKVALKPLQKVIRTVGELRLMNVSWPRSIRRSRVGLRNSSWITPAVMSRRGSRWQRFTARSFWQHSRNS